MAGIIKRITGAGFTTEAQPTNEVVEPVEPVSAPVPLGTQSMFKLAGTETLTSDHLKTIFPMGAPECYKVGMLAPVPVQLEGFDKAQPRLLVAEPAPVAAPAEVPAASLDSPSAAAPSAAFGGPSPAAVIEAVEPLAPAVESLGAPAVDTKEAAPEPAKKPKKSKKTKDGKVKAKGSKSRKAICC